MSGDQAASALTNLTPYAWALFIIAGTMAGSLLGLAAWTFGGMVRDIAVLAVALARSVIRRQRLIGAIAKVDGAQRPTRAMDLGDLVISREQERYAAHLASCPTEVIDPDPALGCTWCKPGTLRAWPCHCASQCGDPACVAAVRHG